MDSSAVWQADAVALADRVGELLLSVRSAEAELGALLVDIEARGVMDLFGYRSVARLLEHLADLPQAAAERVVKRARAVNPGHTLDGSAVPAAGQDEQRRSLTVEAPHPSPSGDGGVTTVRRKWLKMTEVRTSTISRRWARCASCWRP